MKILVLEDEAVKLDKIKIYLKSLSKKITIITCGNFQQFNTFVERELFDFIVVDLLVPVFDDSPEAVDVAGRVVAVARDGECVNCKTPIVALTQFDYAAEENYKDLNDRGVSIVTYDSSESWKSTLGEEVLSCMPNPSYEVVIVCALKKEARAFEEAGYPVGAIHMQHGLECREITLGERECLIVTAPRMGLVGAAIATARSIDLFKPRLVCMGGICAGHKGQANIYDVVITSLCQQHDFGKWTAGGFVLEPYAVQLNHMLKLKVEEILEDSSFQKSIAAGVTLKASEFPPQKEELNFEIFMAPTSSGSAVVADDEVSKMIGGQHRKASAFEMEAFAVYEACRLAQSQPLFFSAKSVVDDGGETKSDTFQRVAAILSAKTVGELIVRGV